MTATSQYKYRSPSLGTSRSSSDRRLSALHLVAVAPLATMTSLCASVLLALLVQASLVSATLIRKNVKDLTPQEVLDLQSYMRELEEDDSPSGFAALAGYHGEPSGCTDSEGQSVACCLHGMATFPQWHRLYVVQAEQLLVKRGLAKIGIPYWDWTEPLKELPTLVQDPIFRDPNGGLGRRNAWFSGEINVGSIHTRTARAVDERLFESVAPGHNTHLMEMVLDALEQDEYCHFEVQFEVAHNNIHYLVGGRHEYSMSTLEWTSYDPIFFLHHSNVDRIWAIWQELQKKRGKDYDHADCSVELFRQKLQPFDKDSNPVTLTRTFSTAKNVFSYSQLGYAYDDLSLNGWNIDELYRMLEQRKGRERAFATFALHGLGFSANVRVKVCEHLDEDYAHEESSHCQFAGDIFILGGANEMKWEFTLPYYFDISDAVLRLGQPLDGNYIIKTEVFSVNGTELQGHLLPDPVGAHRPIPGTIDPKVSGLEARTAKTVIRKDVDVLTDEEVYALRQALSRFQNDSSVDGYQAVAEFHGLPARCPSPDARVRYACCVHGMATFPHWHRLFVVQVEDSLERRGLEIGIPYWDWTKPGTKVPALASDETYVDPVSGSTVHNPFYNAPVAFLGKTTSRQVQDDLFEDPKYGDHTGLFDAMLLAFEQRDFCDFEVQFEVIHNLPHFMVGGFAPYSLSTLHYSAFDPIFILHHSNVDRLWAIWQALQIKRGLPYKAHCANSLTHESLKPFGFPPPLNNNEKTFSHATPVNVYDYEKELGYGYDTLQYGGMTIDQLEDYIDELSARDRTYVGVLLHNIGVSAKVVLSIQAPGGEPYQVGVLAVLGGEAEMPWNFDRVVKVEITGALSNLGLNYDDDFEVIMKITDVTGKEWPEDTYSHHTIIFEKGHVIEKPVEAVEKYVRSDVDSLSREQIQNLREALQALEDDSSVNGYAQIAGFHGQPNWCPSPDAEKKLACCPHGMATFPHWHRLITVQAENALRKRGFHDGLPYWDWTLPMTKLPDLVASEMYLNPETGTSTSNPFHHGVVNGHQTTRSVRPELFEQPEFGKLTKIAEMVLLAYEQTGFCDFEVQFEIAHNYIHALVGGSEIYSMASLRYTAFDPLFFLHHSNTDRIWATWQALQRYRGKPYNSANCAIASLRKPLQPFAQSSVINPDAVTRDHSVPFDTFDYQRSFHYSYDNFQFNGLSLPQIQREIVRRQTDDRVFVGFMLQGIGQSALVSFKIIDVKGEPHKGGEFYILGDESEIPWQYDRLFKFEITRELEKYNIDQRDPFSITYDVYNLAGDELPDLTYGQVTIIKEPGAGSRQEEIYKREVQAASHVRRNIETLSKGEIESLRNALSTIEKDGTFENIARFHGYPGLCEHGGRSVSCCDHGSATFPHWHRLYVEQVENALLSQGSAVAVPYWDWTQPIRQLPDLINEAHFFNSRTQSEEPNPFFQGKISDINQVTTRDPRPELFNSDYLLNNVLLALEKTSFCDFEIQFEIVHNSLHSWVGGRGKYSLSSLDFAAFDPVFFLHHSNVDRIWAIWQELQRYRGLPFDRADCAINAMQKPLRPFDDQGKNLFDVTHRYSRPVDVFDYSHHLDYTYDNLNFNSWTIPQLEEVLKKQRSRDRLFAGFLPHNIGTSADVFIRLCVDTGNGERNCNHDAGVFSILGGETEMPFIFDRLYKFDISDPVRKLGFKLDSPGNLDLDIKIRAYNGSYLEPSVLRRPSLIFVPGTDNQQNAVGKTERRLVRKSVTSLSLAERRSLVLAMQSLQADSSANGFQALASFHALPPLCPYPEANQRFACCVHGMATFPQWHRLYTVQFEDALRRRGAIVGIPYWDTISPQKTLPAFFMEETYHDPVLDIDIPNPWAGAAIKFENTNVEREFNTERLAKDGEHGYDTWLWKQYIFALEQENYCDFEVQFEIAHNAIHALVGGTKVHSMAHLHYASYDPIFLLHHSSTDRIYALWQELQRLRGHDPNEANCALELMREPLKPFSFGPPYNLDPVTKEYSKPEDVFDYENHFLYKYDILDMEGVSPELVLNYINKEKEKGRVFAGFLLEGIKTSAHVDISVCAPNGTCTDAGDFNVLGGSAEMPWSFDRLYRYEITDVLKKAGLKKSDSFTVSVAITSIDGTSLSSSLIPTPSVIYLPAKRKRDIMQLPANRIRRDLSTFDLRDKMTLKAALKDLQNDNTKSGWQALAAMHGVPVMCPVESPSVACCIHGMPTFPHWHRLYTVQAERELLAHGSSVALPYWDWTKPITELPELFTQQTYYDPWRNEVEENPFARSYINEAKGYTVRDPQPELFKTTADGKNSVLYEEVLLALEQTDYCDFEVQYEVTHNAIHYLVGGHQTYALSSLSYASYDPIFFVHHSFVDKIWAVWQELQKRRNLPHDRANCAVNFVTKPMLPFSSASLNEDPFTREHAVAQDVFDYLSLNYAYDNLMLGGHTLEEIEEHIQEHRNHPRVFAGFLLHGIETSAEVKCSICTTEKRCGRAGAFFVLGSNVEMPWAFDRLYKYDITDALKEMSIRPEDVFDAQAPFSLECDIIAVNGTSLPRSSLPPPTIIFEPAEGASAERQSYELSGVGVRKNINTLTVSEIENLKRALQAVEDDQGTSGYQNIASAHGYPGKCKENGHAVACCHHGMASFPQWHRLFVLLLERAITRQGGQVGIPYWDWTESFTALPSLLTQNGANPFSHGEVAALHQVTTRAPRPQLFSDPERGEESFFYRQILLAFEQRDYCDFEVQFEVTHNAIHSWIGGTSPYGMSTLEYSAFDPIFFIHHSNVDRQFAIWQALQRYRGMDYDNANCNIQELRLPLEPFNWDDIPYPVIRENARAIDVFNYDKFNYQYDNLNFHGKSIPQLEELLEKRKNEDRIFANFMLQGIGASADVKFDLCDKDHHCIFAGTFAVLGGPLEMKWKFDRLFKYDVTAVFQQLHLRPDSEYHFDVHITAVNGSELSSSLLEAPSVSFVPGKRHGAQAVSKDEPQPSPSDDLVRYEVSALTLEQVSNLKNALYKLQNDDGPNGFEAIASFHGAPSLCPENATDRYACCTHGMPVFPHWHRLLTVQFEMSLKEHGARVGVPYWDWTRPAKAMPSLLTDPTDNPFSGYRIKTAGQQVTRDVKELLFNRVQHGSQDYLFEQTLETLEEGTYCDFEVQLEMLHNTLHALVGGSGTYSMATLDYSAFDPFFMIHHSSIDRIWKIWQMLQKLRHRPFNFARCAARSLFRPLEPFSYESVNPNPVTRANSKPIQIFDTAKFHYEFDNLNLNGHSVEEIDTLIKNLRAKDRVFAGFVLSGFATSATAHVEVGALGTTEVVDEGSFYILGGPKELPWAYERVYKYDITHAVNELHVSPYSPIDISVTLTRYDGSIVEASLPAALVVVRPANADYDVLVVPVGTGIDIPPKVIVRRGTQIRFVARGEGVGNRVREMGSYTTLTKCAIPPGDANAYEYNKNYALQPGEYYFTPDNVEACKGGRRIQISVDEE